MKLRYLIAFLLVVAIGVGFWIFTKSNAAKPQGEEESSEKATQVQLATIEKKAITEAVSAFGTVVPVAGKMVSLNLPFESVVRHVLVTRGQSFQTNDLLIQINASPAVQLQFRQAQLTKDLTQRELAEAEKQFGLKLATNKDLNEAQKAARDAELTVESLQQQGVNTIAELRKPQVLASTYLGSGTARGTNLPVVSAPDGRPFVLFLDVPPAKNFQSYSAELLSPDGSKVWSLAIPAETVAAAKDTLAIQVAPPNGASGQYVLVLRGLNTGQAEGSEIERYPFELKSR